jgi:hypothetical protein
VGEGSKERSRARMLGMLERGGRQTEREREREM